MSYPPSLYPRKLRHTVPVRPPGDYLVTWSDGTLVQDCQSEASALHFINVDLRVVRGVTDAKLTGPDAEYASCDCGCGRVYRDGTGNQLDRNRVFAPDCPTYRKILPADYLRETVADDFMNERRR